MPRKKTRRQEPPSAVQRKPRRRIIIAIAIALSLLAGGAAMALRGGSEPQTDGKETQVTPAGLTPGSPSKEYIYAGGRLIATEEPAGSTCSYVIAPTSQSFSSAAGSGTVSVTAGAGCAWTATSNDAWITINSGTPGSGNGSVGFSVVVNSGAARNGTMTIAGQTFTVSQAAPGCSYSISPSSQSFAASAGSGTVAVTAGAGCGWTATSNAAWITINSGTPGSGNGSVGFSVAANSGAARNGTMTIAGQTFTVNQAAPGCSYSISPSSQSFAASAGSGTVGVTAGAGCAWTAISNDAWITITSGTPGSGNGSVGFSVALNSGVARNGTMTIAGQTFTVSQAAGGGGGTAPSLSGMSPITGIQGASFTLTINGSNLAGTTSINLTPPDDVTFTNISSTAGQITCTMSIGAAAAVGGRFVTVTTASGGLSTNALSFGILSSSPAPTISTLSPIKQAPGTTLTLTINGTNLSQTTSVNFNSSAGITVSNMIVVSSVKVTATITVASGATISIRQVSVTTPFGTSNTVSYSVQTAPR